jgi:hypothetical protein
MSATRLNRFLRSLGTELFGDDGPNTRGDRLYFRLVELFILAYAVWFCWDWGLYIQQNITSVLLPLGLANYVDVSFLFDHNVALINAGLVALLAVVGFFRLWRPAYLLALVAFHFQYVARYSLGEISHGSNLIGMGVLGLGVALLVFRSESMRRRFTFGFLYFFIGLGYTSAAVCKLIGTGIMWPDGRHLLMWIAERKVDTLSKFGAFEPNLLQEWVLTDYRVGTAILLFGLLTEAVSFLMWWRPYRYPVVLLVVGMHLGIYVSMNIFFAASTYFLILLGLPWNRVFDALLGTNAPGLSLSDVFPRRRPRAEKVE